MGKQPAVRLGTRDFLLANAGLASANARPGHCVPNFGLDLVYDSQKTLL